MNDEIKNEKFIDSILAGVSKGLVAVLTSILSLLIYVPLYLLRDRLPDWAILLLEPRLVVSGILLIGLGLYICIRTRRQLPDSNE